MTASSFDDEDARELLARRLPKAELHMHHVGSLGPAAFAQARPTPPEAIGPAFDNRGPDKFFADLEEAMGRLPDESAVEVATVRMLAEAFDRGARHVELLCTPTVNEARTGLAAERTLAAVGRAFAQVRAQLGLTGGIVVELHRPDGGEAATALVKATERLREDGVPILGFGSDGDHRGTPLTALAPAYRAARAAGFRLTGHAMSAADVVTALDLGFERIDHGWVAAADPALLARLAGSGVVLTFTPMAYLLGGHAASIPWPEAYHRLTEAGVPLVIGTDDPPLHHTDLAHSYDLAARRLGWTTADLAAAAVTSFAHAWSDVDLVPLWGPEIEALALDPRAPRRQG